MVLVVLVVLAGEPAGEEGLEAAEGALTGDLGLAAVAAQVEQWGVDAITAELGGVPRELGLVGVDALVGDQEGEADVVFGEHGFMMRRNVHHEKR